MNIAFGLYTQLNEQEDPMRQTADEEHQHKWEDDFEHSYLTLTSLDSSRCDDFYRCLPSSRCSSRWRWKVLIDNTHRQVDTSTSLPHFFRHSRIQPNEGYQKRQKYESRYDCKIISVFFLEMMKWMKKMKNFNNRKKYNEITDLNLTLSLPHKYPM